MRSEKIGQRIRKLMEEKGLGLADLAERTGLNKAFIERVGDGEALPALGPLLKIARALGVRPGTFMDDHIGSDPLVVRKTERDGRMSKLRISGQPGKTRYYSLGEGKSDRRMEPFFVELLPETEEEKTMSSHEGEEFIVVADGEVAVFHGGKTHVLGPGDSIYFNSVVPHHVGCNGGDGASIYAVLYSPE